ncbi:hypothetical protein YC2023_101867 [Brassica napus]
MQNVWSVPCRFSGLNPPSAVAGDPPGDPPLKPLTLPTKTPPFHHKTFQPYLMQNLFQSPQLVSDLCLLPLLNVKRAFLKLQKSQWLQLILLLLGATLLHVTIWGERNACRHSQIFRSTDQVFKLLDRQLRNKLQSFRNSNPTRSSTMLQKSIRSGTDQVSGSLSGGSIILLSLSGSEVLGYLDVGYPSKNWEIPKQQKPTLAPPVYQTRRKTRVLTSTTRKHVSPSPFIFSTSGETRAVSPESCRETHAIPSTSPTELLHHPKHLIGTSRITWDHHDERNLQRLCWKVGEIHRLQRKPCVRSSESFNRFTSRSHPGVEPPNTRQNLLPLQI